jgi:putative flippase GtrA
MHICLVGHTNTLINNNTAWLLLRLAAAAAAAALPLAWCTSLAAAGNHCKEMGAWPNL